MYWNYKSKVTNLPNELKSENIKVCETVGVLLSHDQKKTDSLLNYSADKIRSEWQYYKGRYNGDNHWLELNGFIDGNYKLLYAVIKDPQYASVLCVIVDKETNEIHALSGDYKSLDELIKKNKNLNGSKENNAWWYFYWDECKVFEFCPLHTYTQDMKMPTYLGLWSKDVVLFDNYTEAQTYSRYVGHKVEIKNSQKSIKKSNSEIKKNGTLEDAIEAAIEIAKKEWESRNSSNLRNIEFCTKRIETCKLGMDCYEDWVKELG